MKRKEKKRGKTCPTASNMPPGIPFLLTSLQAEFLKRSFLIIMTAALIFVFVFLFLLQSFLIIRTVALGKQRKSVEETQLELKENVDEVKKQIGEVKDILASLKEALRKDDI